MAIRLWVAADVVHLGKDLELPPLNLAWHSTWGSAHNRFSLCHENLPVGTAWVELGVLTDLPNPVAHEADDQMLHFVMFSKTRTSGIKEIDAVQSASVLLDIPSGEGLVGLTELLQAGDVGVEIPLVSTMIERDARSSSLHALAEGNDHVFSDQEGVLGKERVQELDSDVFHVALKVEMRLRAEVLDSHAVATFSQHMAAVPADRLLYGTPAMLEAAAKSFARQEEVYVERMTNLTDPRADEKYRFVHDPNEALLENLHMFRFETPSGPLPPIAMVMQAPLDRGLEVDSSPAFFTAFADKLEVLLHATALRNGMTADTWADIIERQFARTDDVVHGDFRTAGAIMCQLGTFSANQISYESDQCVPNTDWLQRQTVAKQRQLAPHLFADAQKRPETGAAANRPDLFELRKMRTGGLLTGATMSSGRFTAIMAGLKRETKQGLIAVTAAAAMFFAGTTGINNTFATKSMFLGEMWDYNPGAGVKNSGDCEDSGVKAAKYLDALLLEARRNPEFGHRRLLKALKLMLELYYPSFDGAAVSEPYVKTDGTKKEAHHRAPLIGSHEDLVETQQAGHAHGMNEPEPTIMVRTLRGIEVGELHVEDRAAAAQLLRSKLNACPPWAKYAPSFVLEGTGTIREIGNSFEEAYAGMERADVHVRKGAAIMHMAHALKSKATAEHGVVAEFCRIQAQPLELWTQEENRRRSTFYRSLGHVIIPRLYREVAPTLGHLTPVRVSKRLRGINIGDYLNASHPDVALVSVYGHRISVAEWHRDHEPYMRAQLNQQPLFAELHRDMPAKAEQGQPLASVDLMALAHFSIGVGPEHLTACLNQRGLSVALAASPVALQAGLGHNARPPDEVEDLELLLSSHQRDDLAVLPNSIPAWKMPALGHEKTATLLLALDTMRARGDIRGYVLERAKPMRRCADVIQLLLVLPVAETVDLTEFPRPARSGDQTGYIRYGAGTITIDTGEIPIDAPAALGGYFTTPTGRPYEDDVTGILKRVGRQRTTPADVKSLLLEYDNTTVGRLADAIKRHTKTLTKMQDKDKQARRQRAEEEDDAADLLFDTSRPTEPSMKERTLQESIDALQVVLAQLFEAEVVNPMGRLMERGALSRRVLMWIGSYGNEGEVDRVTLDPDETQRQTALVHIRSLHHTLAHMAHDMADDGLALWTLYWDRMSEAILGLDNMAGSGSENRFVVVRGDVFDPREPSLAKKDAWQVLPREGAAERVTTIRAKLQSKKEGKMVRHFVRLYPRCVATLFEMDRTTSKRQVLVEYGTLIGGERAPLQFADAPTPESYETTGRRHAPDDAVTTGVGQWI